MQDKDFEEERAWLLLKDVPVAQEVPLAGKFLQNAAPGGTGTSAAHLDALAEDEGGLECGCCFSPAPFVCSPHF